MAMRFFLCVSTEHLMIRGASSNRNLQTAIARLMLRLRNSSMTREFRRDRRDNRDRSLSRASRLTYANYPRAGLTRRDVLAAIPDLLRQIAEEARQSVGRLQRRTHRVRSDDHR